METAESPSPLAQREIQGAAHLRATRLTVFTILAYQGYAFSLLGVAAPFIATGFGLDQSGIARMYAWISLNSLGALLLSRMADRIGRRRILLFTLVATPLCSLGAALAHQTDWFILFEIIVYAAVGAAITSSIVMLAEASTIDKRSQEQGVANLASGFGGGVCVVAAPIIAYFGWSWRWLFALPVLGLLLLPPMLRLIPESRRWQNAADAGATSVSRFYDVFRRRYRARSIPLIIATLIGETAGAAIPTWIYFHAVSVVHLSPAKGSAILLIGGAVSIFGLALGVRMSERFGRVRTVVILGFAGIGGVLAFYWGPPAGFLYPTLWLTLAHTWFATTGRGLTVAANSAVTELFPTALRGTIIGWLLLCIAIAAIGAQASIAILAKPFGSLSNVVGWIALLTIPSVAIWGFFIDETGGMALEAAARESAG